ncbi:LacI family DNA-binding transcriptional regulator [Alphaproteobacteria bacterium LSUCC0719]
MTRESRIRFQDHAPRVRVTDVAKLAECAPATVSRTINNPEKVSPEKRLRIEAAMRDLGYLRNHAARALRSQRSHMIGILIPTLAYALYANLVGAASRQLSEAGITTLIATFDYDLKVELAEAKMLVERGAEALIMIGQDHDPGLYSLLDQYDLPFVNTYVFAPNGTRPCIGFDNAAAAASITRHLIHLGHRDFCIISGITKDNDRTTQRLDGIKRELLDHGISLGPSQIVERRYSIANGREACAALLAKLDPKPTAIICGNDILAMGAIVECTANGLHVPRDISVVGFDNYELSKHSNPPLTTIDVPAEEMGGAAADYLLSRLEGDDVPSHRSVDVQLILRDSSAPPPPKGARTLVQLPGDHLPTNDSA